MNVKTSRYPILHLIAGGEWGLDGNIGKNGMHHGKADREKDKRMEKVM